MTSFEASLLGSPGIAVGNTAVDLAGLSRRPLPGTVIQQKSSAFRDSFHL